MGLTDGDEDRWPAPRWEVWLEGHFGTVAITVAVLWATAFGLLHLLL